MHSTTREHSETTTQIIYQISEREAFVTILDIYAIELPKQSVDGREVRGYWYDIHSSGSRMFENPLRHNRIRQMIQEKLQKTAIVVTNVQDAEYETDGKEYPGLKRDARDIKLGVQPSGASNVDRLNELKAMRDRGLITEEEYQAKRRQILDRM